MGSDPITSTSGAEHQGYRHVLSRLVFLKVFLGIFFFFIKTLLLRSSFWYTSPSHTIVSVSVSVSVTSCSALCSRFCIVWSVSHLLAVILQGETDCFRAGFSALPHIQYPGLLCWHLCVELKKVKVFSKSFPGQLSASWPFRKSVIS